MRCKTKHLARACKTTGCRPFSSISSPQTLFFTENHNLKVLITAKRLMFLNRNTASKNKNYRTKNNAKPHHRLKNVKLTSNYRLSSNSWLTSLFWTQNHFPWICSSVIYYWLFWTPAISNCSPFPLRVRKSEVQLHWSVYSWLWGGEGVGRGRWPGVFLLTRDRPWVSCASFTTRNRVRNYKKYINNHKWLELLTRLSKTFKPVGFYFLVFPNTTNCVKLSLGIK